MNVGIVDVFIVIFVLLGAIVGFKNGAIKEGTKFIGLFVAVMVAFIFKDRLMLFLCENLPFFDFFGLIKGIGAINVLVYQVISFLIIFAACMFVIKILTLLTGFVEWVLKLTVVLSFPSKIIGIFVGALEYYVYVFIILFVLNMPVFNLTLVSESKFGLKMLENTPVLSSFVEGTVNVYGEVWDIIDDRDNLSDKEVNTLLLVTLLDNKLITVNSATKLVDSNKILIEDESILDNYQDDNDIYNELKERYYGK